MSFARLATDGPSLLLGVLFLGIFVRDEDVGGVKRRLREVCQCLSEFEIALAT